MIDSTARAPRFESDSSPAPAYLWAPPQKLISVSIPLAVIDQLEREAVESFRSLSSRGSEIGGILFGGVQAGSPQVVAIDSYQPVECEYSGGPLYRLTDAELARLDRAIEQRLASGVRAVGFYRTHTRKGLSLDTDDLALFDSRFREAHHIALLIRPAATKVSMAGIFFREDGTIHGDASCLEFPFRSGQHEATKRVDSLYDGAVAGPRSVNAAAAQPKPVIRAQIVPIASRREIAPEVPPPPTVQSAPEPVERLEKPEKVELPPTPPAPAPVVVTAAVEAPKPPAPVEPKPVVSAVEPTLELPVDAPKPRLPKVAWIALGVAIPAVLAVGFVLTSGMLHRGGAGIPAAAQDSSPLALRVDRNGTDIVLTWNRDSDAIRRASKAVLQIADGAQHENVDMDLTQLRNGSIVYSPVTSDVVFKMEVSGAGQSKTVSESVRVLRTRPSPMPEAGGQQPSPEQAQTAQTASATATGGPAAESTPAAEEEKPVALAQASKPFHAESLATRLHAGAAGADMPDAPMLGTPAPATSASVNLGGIVSAQQAPVPPPPAASAPVATPAAAAAAKKAPGGQIQEAQLLRRRDPDYPKLARDAGASGIVEVVATIGPDGRVKAVRVVRGHPLLRQAATDAVKSWLYRPTMLNGVAVETETQILLNFKSDR
jgi:TonB family protein